MKRKYNGYIILLISVFLSIFTGCTVDISDYQIEQIIQETTEQSENNQDVSEPKSDSQDVNQTESSQNFILTNPVSDKAEEIQSDNKTEKTLTVEKEGTYTDKEHVALYISIYNSLPSNFITKNEAENRGWKNNGTLDKVCPGMSIGGDKFGNREGNLPKEKGRQYYECDIDYEKGNRNAKRIVYSNDGLVYYTEDHYNTFELLYGTP